MHKLSYKLNNASYYCLLLAIFSIPFSTAAMNVLFALTVLLVWISGDWQRKWQAMSSNPIVWYAMLLFALYIIGLLYSDGSWHQRLHGLGKYHKLLLIPLLTPLFVKPKWQDRAIKTFVIAMLIVMLVNYLDYFYIILKGLPIPQGGVFKNHSTGNLLMAVTVYLLLWLAKHQVKYRWRLGLLAVFAIYHVLFLNQGRIGYLVLAALLILFCWQNLSWQKFLALCVLGLVIIFIMVKFIPAANHLADNLIKGGVHRSAAKVSNNARIHQTKMSWKIIKANSVVGVGTGGYANAYSHVAISNNDHSDNSQSQYLQTWVELGTLGLLVLLLFLVQQWRYGLQLSPALKEFSQALVVMQIVASFTLAILQDTTESHFFAVMIALCFATLAVRKHHA